MCQSTANPQRKAEQRGPKGLAGRCLSCTLKLTRGETGIRKLGTHSDVMLHLQKDQLGFREQQGKTTA